MRKPEGQRAIVSGRRRLVSLIRGDLQKLKFSWTLVGSQAVGFQMIHMQYLELGGNPRAGYGYK